MLSEFELIERFFTFAARHTVLGAGDDAALVRVRAGHELAVSTDMLIAGRHFFSDVDPRRLGHKALAVNLSDMAAMGAHPRWVTLSLALPRAEARWLRAFARGFMALARRHDVDLIGGDTTRGPLAICVQIMGEVPRGKALRRDGARPGDDVWVSGTLGEAALAVAARKRRVALTGRELAHCMRRLDLPQPRIALGVALRGVANGAIDVSDGLAADLGHICERSRVGAEIAWETLPRSTVLRRHEGKRAVREALLAGGDDYELVFTAPVRERERIATIGRALRLRLTRIGLVSASPHAAVRVLREGRPLVLKAGGYDHFR